MSLNKNLTGGLELVSGGIQIADGGVIPVKLSGGNLSVSGTVTAGGLQSIDTVVGATSDVVIHGLANGFEGRTVDVVGIGGSLVSVVHSSASAAASDQILLVNSEDMPPTVRGCLRLRYLSGKWREIARSSVSPNARAAALTTLTQSTGTLTWASLSIPANSLVPGSCYDIYAAMNYSRGATATAANLSWTFRFAGNTNLNDTRATLTANGATGYVLVRGRIWCSAIGATGSITPSLECNYNIDGTERRLFTHGGSVVVDTTAAILIDARSNFSAAVAGLSQAIAAGNIFRI